MNYTKLIGYKDFEKESFDIISDSFKNYYVINFNIHKFSTNLSIDLTELITNYITKYFTEVKKYCFFTYKDLDFLLLCELDNEEMVNEFYNSFIKFLEDNRILNSVKLTCGAYFVNDHLESIQEIIEKAKLSRLYDNEKFNSLVFFNHQIFEKYVKESYIRNSFYDSIDNGDILLYLQPKYDAETGKLCGAEALSRWRSNGVIMMPGEYIECLEKTGQIIILDKYIYEQTMIFLSNKLKNKEKIVPVSVNFSQKHTFDKDFIKFLKDTADKYDVSYNYIHIEITESALNSSIQNVFDILDEIRFLGFKVELDDFGMGYSNIEMLTRMPIDYLKIDKILFKNIKDPNFVYFYSCIISLAHKLGFKVIIEGVESIEHLNIIKEMQCDYVQGFYFSKPIEKEEFNLLLNKDNIIDISKEMVELVPFDIAVLKRLFDNSNNPYYIIKVVNSKIQYVYVNKGYANIYSKTPSYFIGKKMNDVLDVREDIIENLVNISMSNSNKTFYDSTLNKKYFAKYNVINLAPTYVSVMIELDFDDLDNDYEVVALEKEDSKIKVLYETEKVKNKEYFKKNYKNFYELYEKNQNLKNNLVYKDIIKTYDELFNEIILFVSIKPVYNLYNKIILVCYLIDITNHKNKILK